MKGLTKSFRVQKEIFVFSDLALGRAKVLNREFQKVLVCLPVTVEKSLNASKRFAVFLMSFIAPANLLAAAQSGRHQPA